MTEMYFPKKKKKKKTGGQDDLVTAYSLIEQRVIARCQGHASFVTALSFDPWFSDDRSCRFASVSEDCKLIFVSESCLLITIIQKKKKPISNLLCLVSGIYRAPRWPNHACSRSIAAKGTIRTGRVVGNR